MGKKTLIMKGGIEKMGKKTLIIVLGIMAVFILVSFDSAKAAEKQAKVFNIRGQVAWGPGTGV
ncbi:MAG: hypothetical protein K8S13_17080, partial [Desulfobacula sp.]|uniref:hypothetical protein n=1 Tax=Desulfobacula sp. TaxID=2593537 RepID=UPI0025BE463D